MSERYGVKPGTVRNWRRSMGDIPAPPANVLSLPAPKTVRKPKGKPGESDEERKARKLSEYRAHHSRVRAEARVAALGPVDRVSVRRIIRRLVKVQETGLWCPSCGPGVVLNPDSEDKAPQLNRLEPKDFLSMTRALHLNLEKLGPLLEVEGRLEEQESTERDADYYEGEQGREELAADLSKLGPRVLSMVLAENPEARAVVQAALEHSQRSTG